MTDFFAYLDTVNFIEGNDRSHAYVNSQLQLRVIASCITQRLHSSVIYMHRFILLFDMVTIFALFDRAGSGQAGSERTRTKNKPTGIFDLL